MARVFHPSMAHKGKAFEDTIDGYFPLHESLRQMTLRHDFDVALIQLNHAPAMDIPGLGFEEPVPLSITAGRACMIHKMLLVLECVDNGLTVSGVGRWTWWGGHHAKERVFSSDHRLAEPAFVRGISWKDWQPSGSDRDEEEDERQHRLTLVHNQILEGDYALQEDRLTVRTTAPSNAPDPALSLQFTVSDDLMNQVTFTNFWNEIEKAQ